MCGIMQAFMGWDGAADGSSLPRRPAKLRIVASDDVILGRHRAVLPNVGDCSNLPTTSAFFEKHQGGPVDRFWTGREIGFRLMERREHHAVRLPVPVILTAASLAMAI
jgi:hypothetical protein